MGTKYEMPEPESKAEARAPDGAAPDLFAGNDLFADVECPLKNIPAIQLISTQRPTTSPWLMTCHPLLDIRGPENWPDDTPLNQMTATYVPIEHDVRYCNANLIGVREEDRGAVADGFLSLL